MLYLHSLRHAYPEGAGFFIDRKRGHEAYTFLHFFEGVDIRVCGELLHTEPHACILYRIGTPQYFRTDTGLVHDWIHFTGDIEPLMSEVGLPFDTPFYPSGSSFITSLVRELENEFYNRRIGYERFSDAKLTELFVKLGRACRGEGTPKIDAATRKRFHALRGSMLSSPERRHSTREMAEAVGLSESRFYAVYRTLYGISPTEDLIHARVETAKGMLAFGDLTLAEIAEALGYASLSHFLRQFKVQTGVTPTAYREENQN